MKKTLFLVDILVIITLFYSQAAAQIITTVAGNGTSGYSGDGGAALSAELALPTTVASDMSGNIYIADYSNNVIRKVNTSGIITTIAGNGTPGYSGDGAAATAAQLYDPGGIAIDASGNIYIADYYNNVIRKVNVSGIITTIAGNGTPGYSGDGGAASAAHLQNPTFVTVDIAGNLYIADTGNSVIRKVNASGVITTVAGNYSMGPGYSGDGGPATAARLHDPLGIAVDASGNLYIADLGNNRVRMVNTSGIITTVAGNGTSGYSGDGMQATASELYNPVFVTVDAPGNLYITDAFYARIRKVGISGIITTVAGNGTMGYSGDGGPATAAQLDDPGGVTIDISGDLYIADGRHNRIRKVNIGTTGLEQVATAGNNMSVYPNPASDIIFVSIPEAKGTIALQDIAGRQVAKKKVTSTITSFDIHTIPHGIYFAVWNDGSGAKAIQKIVAE